MIVVTIFTQIKLTNVEKSAEVRWWDIIGSIDLLINNKL